MTSAGLTLTRQAPATADATLTLDERPPTTVWTDLATATHIRIAFVDAILETAAGRTYLEYVEYLDSEGVDALDGRIATLAARIARGESNALSEFVAQLPELGHGRSTLADVRSTARLFAVADDVTTVAVRLTREFREQDAGQRRSACRLLATLARGCDVRVYGSGLDLRWLATQHRQDLPSVSETWKTTPELAPASSRVEAGKDALDPDGRAVHVLQRLADEDSETLSYSALDSQLTVSRSRRSQLVSQLADLGLVDTFGPRTSKHVELLPAGRQYLDWLQSEIARQRTLDDCVSELSEPSDDSREDTRTHVRGEDRGRRRLPALHTVQPLARWDATATAASAPENGVSMVDYPLQEQEDRGSPRWYYDYVQDALVVGAEYDGPMQYWVCVARALASRRTFAAVLDDGDRLDDTEDVGELLADHKAVLRDSTCLGHLPDRVEDGADYVDELAAAERHLCELTRDLATGQYEESSESEVRATITREALGLAKTLWDVLDLAGVDVVLQVRLPRQNDGRHDALKKERRHTLVQSLVTGVQLLGRAGWSSVYRQLFETDEDRRAAAIQPSMGAFDVGELAGSICVVGDLGTAGTVLVDELQGRLRGVDEDIHEDAPEITMPVIVRGPGDHGRPAFGRAVERMCAGKGLTVTREAVSVLRLFTATAFDAARAVSALSSEDEDRRIRLSEVRYGLAAALDESRVMPWEARGVQQIVAGLLSADGPLAVAELVDAAGVGRSTWYDHVEWLQAMGVVVETERGYRLALAAHSEDERYSERCPWFVKGEGESGLPVTVLVRSLGHRLADRLLPDGERSEYFASFRAGAGGGVDRVTGRWPRVARWLDALRAVAGADSGPVEPVVVGRRQQASLTAAMNGGVSA